MNIDGYALVVGGADITQGSGIGRACALAFAEEGASGIMIADLDVEAAKRVATETKAVAKNPSLRVEAFQVDVASEDSVNIALEHWGKAFGRLDYCVNCAGIGVEKAAGIANADVAEFMRFLTVNVTGSFLVTRAASAIMVAQEARQTQKGAGSSRGAIVNMASASSFVSTPGMVQYTTSKHAVLGLTKNAALDNAALGVRVNCICSSWVDTPMVRKAIEQVPGLDQLIEAAVPMGRMALPEEIAQSVIFLCSPRSSFITGCGLIIDGGTTLTSKV